MTLKGIGAWLKHTGTFIVDSIFPQDDLTTELLSLSPSLFYKTTARSFSRDDIEAILEYRNPLVQKAIWEVKYRKNEKIAALLGSVLTDFLLERLSDEAVWNTESIVFVPIPLSSARLKERGFNQVELILKKMVKCAPHFMVRMDLLQKLKETPSQTSRTKRNERLLNIKNSFTASLEVSGLHIVLVDDVTTTGATLSEARHALVGRGATRVTCVALAH